MKRLIVISGLSGSGKSLAAECFEDLGYFCVDNLPVSLIPPFVRLIERGQQVPYAALVIDVRGGAFLKQLPDILLDLRAKQTPVQLLFFECSNDVLKRRFSETRRPHPMSTQAGTLDNAIQEERTALAPLRDIADRIIDTSRYTSHQLKSFLTSTQSVSPSANLLNVNVVSFGFKYGVPPEADLLFDVRFLPNPYFVEGLRSLDGRTTEVQSFLDEIELTGEFMSRLEGFLEFLIPLYAAEGKSYLTVAIGCTGGKHRSVALAERLGGVLTAHERPSSVTHRDLGRE